MECILMRNPSYQLQKKLKKEKKKGETQAFRKQKLGRKWDNSYLR